MSPSAGATEPGGARREAEAKVVLALAEYYRLRASGTVNVSVRAVAKSVNCDYSTLNR